MWTPRKNLSPYGKHHLRALYFPGSNKDCSKTLIVACGGFDSTLEELYFSVAAGALERGYSILLYQGPGQGAALREEGLTFIPEWERPTGAVLDSFLEVHPHPSHIVLMGMSMGGYLAPRAAAFDRRIDGVVAFDVLFDVADALIKLRMSTDSGMQWSMQNAMWVMGVSAPVIASSVCAFYRDYPLCIR